MKLKFKLLAAAVMVVAGAAQAALRLPNTGDGSLAFVAIDQIGSPISLTIDLGYVMSDFVPATSTFDTPGTKIVWDFVSNTRTVNGVASVGNFAWSGALTTFLGTAQAADLQWGVIAADQSSSLGIAGRGWLSTGTPTQPNMVAMNASGPIGNAVGAAQTFINASNFAGTHALNADGANTATSGSGYLGAAMFGNFNNQQQWSYLKPDNTSSRFQHVQGIVSDPTVTQIGAISTLDSLSLSASTFNFDAGAGTLTFLTPVPEPETYAMLLAGLAAIATIVRRRKV